MNAGEAPRLELVGDGYDAEPLLTAGDVGTLLKLPPKSVYELPIPRVRLGPRRIRWRPADVRAFITRRTQA
jgi:predicted DNA-binding transcriptional regulator AlpA